MVNPYDFVVSPVVAKSKRTRKKSVTKTSKKRKSNERLRRTSIRQGKNATDTRTRSNTRGTDHVMDMHDKDNNPNNGFTQLIQTKMMEVKKRQGHRKNKKASASNDENHSSSVTRKRRRSGENHSS